MQGLSPSYEQHSADRTWFIRGERGRWDVVVASIHETTFMRRQDAREYIRARKALVRSSAVG